MVEPGDGGVVFVSYSRDDADWRRRFVEMLKPVVRARRFEVWSDDRMLVGEQWRPQLADAIDRSRVALLLVSGAFLASDYIMEEELPALKERGVQLVPVLIRPCLWQSVATLEQVQWAHDPNRDGAVASAGDPEAQIVRVCQKLLAALPPDVEEPPPPPLAGNAAAVPRADERPGELDGVPPLPASYVAREEVAGLRESLLAAGDGAMGITGNAQALGLHGQGGIGKTVLAAALARDDTVRRHFPDGIFWVTVGESGDLAGAQIELLARLGVAHPELRSATQGLAQLREALAERRSLLVIDDVWSTAAAAAFRATGPHGRILYTSRDQAVLHAVATGVEQVEVLSTDTARRLLAGLVAMPVDALPPETDRILEATGRSALALAIVGAAIGRGGASWRHVVDQLDRGDRTFLDHPYANAFKAMHVGMAALDPAVADAYRSLAVYPEDTVVSIAAVARYWKHLWDASPDETAQQLDVLAGQKLLTVDRDGFSFHDLQREFLLLRAGELSLAHADLLAAYRALLPVDADWSALPHDEPYIWDHLIYHLRGTGDAAGVVSAVCDLAYLAVRSFRGGPYAAESDLRQAAALDLDPAVDWLLGIFRQWGHLLTAHDSLTDLAATLAGRIQDAPPPIEVRRLASLLPTCLLAPLWGVSMATAVVTRVLEAHTPTQVNALAFAPDGRTLASASSDNTVRLWDADSGSPIATLEGHTAGVFAVTFAPDGHTLASAGSDNTVRLWDADSGSSIATCEGHTGKVTAVVFAPDGRTLASAGEGQVVRRWDAASGQPTAGCPGHAGWVLALAYAPNGHTLVSADLEGTVRLWDAARARALALPAFAECDTDDANAAAFAPDGRTLASAGADGTVRLWDAGDGRPITTLEGHTGYVTALAFGPEGRTLATAGQDQTVRTWDTASGERAATFAGHNDWVTALAYAPDGRTLASADFRGTVRLWNVTGAQVDTAGVECDANAVSFAPDGRTLVSAGTDGAVRLWDAADGRPIATLEGHTGRVSAVAFAPDGRTLASGGEDTTARLWDAASGQLITTLRGHAKFVRPVEFVTAVAYAPDGRTLATGGDDETVRLWDVDSGSPIATLEGHNGSVTALAYAPDGRTLASAGNDSTVRVWDTAGGRLTATLEGHSSGLWSVAFAPDGRTIASAGFDNTVRLWDAASSRPVATLEGHSIWVIAVAFAPDGRALASGDNRGTIALWDVDTRTAICQLRVGAVLRALAWGPSGITVGTETGVIHLELLTPNG